MSALLTKLEEHDRVVRRSWHFVSSRLFVYGVVSAESWRSLSGQKSEHKLRCRRVLLDFFGKRSAGQDWLMVTPCVFIHHPSFQRITRAVYLIQEHAALRIQRLIQPLRARFHAARRLQRLARDIVLRPFLEHRAATLIASSYIRWVVRRDFKRILLGAVKIQSAWRSFETRTSTLNPANRASRVVDIQRVFRGYGVRKLLKIVNVSRTSLVSVLWDNECVRCTSLVRVSGVIHKRTAKVQAVLTTKQRLIFLEVGTMKVLEIVPAEEATTGKGNEVVVGEVRFEDLLVEGAKRWVDTINSVVSVDAFFEHPFEHYRRMLRQAVLLCAHVSRRSDRMSFLWRQGWVVLHSTTLFWFNKESPLPKSFIRLQTVTVLDVTWAQDFKRPNVLKVEDGQGTSMLISFATHKEKNQWARHINLSANSLSSASTSAQATTKLARRSRLAHYYPRLKSIHLAESLAVRKKSHQDTKVGLYWTITSAAYSKRHRLLTSARGHAVERRKEIVAERAAQSQWRVVKKAFGGVVETGEETEITPIGEDVERKSESDSGESDYSEAESEHGQEEASSKKEAGTLDAALTTVS